MKGFGHILAKLRKNASMSSTIAQFVGESPVSVFLAWAKRISSNPLDQKVDLAENQMIEYYSTHPKILADLNKVIGRADFGLKSVSLAKIPTGVGVVFAHSGLDFPLLFQSESEGTKSFVKVFPLIKEALIMGGVAVIDELDSTIHPILLPEILHWFYNDKTNPHSAQLWMSGQSASLLEELSKEEIYFTEKDGQGRTRVYGLKDIEGVRRVDNFYQKYLGGAYGAVPRIG
jgi:predicted ATPase